MSSIPRQAMTLDQVSDREYLALAPRAINRNSRRPAQITDRITAQTGAPADAVTPVKRGRGRPKGSKNKKTLAATTDADASTSTQTPRRKRGRPRKVRYHLPSSSRRLIRFIPGPPLRRSQRTVAMRRPRNVSGVDHPSPSLKHRLAGRLQTGMGLNLRRGSPADPQRRRSNRSHTMYTSLSTTPSTPAPQIPHAHLSPRIFAVSIWSPCIQDSRPTRFHLLPVIPSIVFVTPSQLDHYCRL